MHVCHEQTTSSVFQTLQCHNNGPLTGSFNIDLTLSALLSAYLDLELDVNNALPSCLMCKSHVR